MSRVLGPANSQGFRTYMECDEEDCSVSVGPRAGEDALPLSEFASAGWFIAGFYGDCCPKCVEAGRAEGREPMPDEVIYKYPSIRKPVSTAGIGDGSGR